jgi:transposase
VPGRYSLLERRPTLPRGQPKAELILSLSDDERQTLKTWASRPKSTQQLAQRARIVLTCAAGLDNKVVAAQLGVTTQTVGKRRRRFVERRRDGLADQPRPGAPCPVTDQAVKRVITKTPETKPKSATPGAPEAWPRPPGWASPPSVASGGRSA